MIRTFVFVLGRKPELSEAELRAVFGEVMHVELVTKQVLVAEFNEDFDMQKLIDGLGGVMKVCEVFKKVMNLEGVEEHVAEYLEKRAGDFGYFGGERGGGHGRNSGKFLFGVSLYSFSQKHEVFLKKLLKKVKVLLKGAGLKARFLNKPWKSVSDVAVLKEGLVERETVGAVRSGVDVAVLETKDAYYLCEALAVQDFENYGKRDFQKPKRNPKRGMLPPKLAQMMINFSGVNEVSADDGESVDGGGVDEAAVGGVVENDDSNNGRNKGRNMGFMSMKPFMAEGSGGGLGAEIGASESRGIIFDPFCGNGTVLMEAMLMGFDVIGSDISGDAVKDSFDNLQWMVRTFPAAVGRKFYCFQKDVRDLSIEDLNAAKKMMYGENVGFGVKAVVTESYLGPPMKKFPAEDWRQQIDADLGALLMQGFRSFHEMFGRGVPVVLSLPVYRDGKDYFPLEKSVEKITSVGYSAKALLEGQDFLIYDRKDQIVGRQVWRFERAN